MSPVVSCLSHLAVLAHALVAGGLLAVSEFIQGYGRQ